MTSKDKSAAAWVSVAVAIIVALFTAVFAGASRLQRLEDNDIRHDDKLKYLEEKILYRLGEIEKKLPKNPEEPWKP